MRSALDFTPYRQSWIGFDHLFDRLESNQAGSEGFPPFDLEQDGENTYRLRLAVAGFRREDIDITASSNVLVVTGRREDEPERRMLHRGIATATFERQFQLADYMVVTGARLSDGLLEIDLERQIPDAVKPRKIEIASDQRQIENTERRRVRGEGSAKNGKPQKDPALSEAS